MVSSWNNSMSEHLIFTIILSIFLGILSTLMVVFFIDKKFKNNSTISRKESLIFVAMGSLFASIPAMLLIIIISSKTGSKELSGIAFSLFGFSGSLGMLVRKKYNHAYIGAFVLYLVMALIGLIITYK